MKVVFFVVITLVFSTPALAYVGPGAGIGAIAVAFALILGVALLFFGFFWFPLKRFLRRNKTTDKNGITKKDTDSNSPT